jgi:hypothetical protein
VPQPVARLVSDLDEAVEQVEVRSDRVAQAGVDLVELDGLATRSRRQPSSRRVRRCRALVGPS